MKIPTLLILSLGCALTLPAQNLRLVQTVSLLGVEGRIDHLSIDPAGNRLFVAALGNNTVEVVDLRAGKVARSLRGFSEPQGLLYLEEFKRLYVASGGDGSLRVLDGQTFAEVTTIKFDDDADNLRYDAAAKQLYVGYGSGALGIVDVTTNTVVGTIPLSAHPESFQIERTGNRVFVNVPRSHTISVADRNTRKVNGSWALGLVAANFPMTLDEANHRAFIACRTPTRLLVFDTESGEEVARLVLHGDCDDVFYDARRRQVYASCGEGFIDVFTQKDADHYALREAVRTEPRARTAFFDGERLYLAVPRRGEHAAEIQCFLIEP